MALNYGKGPASGSNYSGGNNNNFLNPNSAVRNDINAS